MRMLISRSFWRIDVWRRRAEDLGWSRLGVWETVLAVVMLDRGVGGSFFCPLA